MTFEMGMPIYYQYPICFDALIWKAMKVHEPRYIRPTDMPLERLEGHPEVYMAGLMMTDATDLLLVDIIRPADNTRREFVQVDAGRIYFIYETQEPQYIDKITAEIQNIGAYKNRGMGKVKSYWSEYTTEQIIKPLPIDYARADEIRLGIGDIQNRAYKIPYSDRWSKAPCYIAAI